MPATGFLQGRPARRVLPVMGVRMALLAGLVLLAQACAGTPERGNASQAGCPAVRLASGTLRLMRFADPRARDVTDMAFDARITDARLTCRIGRDHILARVRLSFEATRGEGLSGSSGEAAVFAAAVDGEALLAKTASPARLSFADSHRPIRGEVEIAALRIPRLEHQPPRTIEVFTGFQLTRAELARNRQAARQRFAVR